MENKSKYEKALRAVSLFNLITVIACGAGCVYGFIVMDSVYYKATAIFEIIALLASFAYFTKGYKKDAARYYRAFMLFEAFTYVGESIAAAFEESIDVGMNEHIWIVASLILYGNTLILAVGKDLGKTISFTLCGINFIGYIIPVVVSVVPGAVEYASTPEMISNIILYCTWLVLAGIAGIMTVAKYIDKASRGSK